MKTNKVFHQNHSTQLQKLDGKLRKASQMYERQFLRQMIKAMRSSVSHSSLTKPGMAEKIYREQLDDKYVDSWVDSGGTGFADMVYQELIDKFYPQLGKGQIKKIRPANLTDRYQGISRSLTQPKQSQHLFHIKLKPQQETGTSYLNVPWRGKLESEMELASGEKLAMFSHPFGLKSTLVFRGQLKPGLLNKTLEAGENFAQLNAESQTLTWKIQGADSRKDSSVPENIGFN